MVEPRVMVLRAAGTNCENETAYAFSVAGARPTQVHINELLQKPSLLDDYGLVAIPGGFAYGDDIAAGRVFAVEMAHALGDHFRRFISRGGLILGICNGFQVLIKTGLLPIMGFEHIPHAATLHWNDTHRYESRWVRLQIDPTLCVMAPRDKANIRLPVAHGEGKFLAKDPQILRAILSSHQAVFRYVNHDGSAPDFPANPNGSEGHIAGLCDPTGQVLGLMPHPERALFAYQHPDWTREPSRRDGDGECIFRAAVAAMR